MGMKGPWCLIILHAGCLEVDKLFRLRQGKYLHKKRFRFFQSCVTLGPKHHPLQLLSSEGIDHPGHLVLLAHMGGCPCSLPGTCVPTPGTPVWVSWLRRISPLSAGV